MLLLKDEVTLVKLHLKNGKGQRLVVRVRMVVDEAGLLDIVYLARLMLGRTMVVMWVVVPQHDLLAAFLEGNVTTGLVGGRWNHDSDSAGLLC